MAVKQVIVVRKDLNMRKGKMVAQGAHASLNVLMESYRMEEIKIMSKDQTMLFCTVSKHFAEWLATGQTKICVSIDSKEALLDLYVRAKDAGLPCSLVLDAGRTEFKEATHTAVAIGPGDSDEIDKITGELPLL